MDPFPEWEWVELRKWFWVHKDLVESRETPECSSLANCGVAPRRSWTNIAANTDVGPFLGIGLLSQVFWGIIMVSGDFLHSSRCWNSLRFGVGSFESANTSFFQ